MRCTSYTCTRLQLHWKLCVCSLEYPECALVLLKGKDRPDDDVLNVHTLKALRAHNYPNDGHWPRLRYASERPPGGVQKPFFYPQKRSLARMRWPQGKPNPRIKRPRPCVIWGLDSVCVCVRISLHKPGNFSPSSPSRASRSSHFPHFRHLISLFFFFFFVERCSCV